MPIRQTDKGWYWGSKGPFETKKKALAVQGAAYASGYKGQHESLTKEVLVGLIDEVLNETKWGKAQGRDYSKEKKTAGDSKNIARKRARRAAEKSGRVNKGDGKDVHHPKGYSDGSPTQVMSQSANRGMADEGGRKKGTSK